MERLIASPVHKASPEEKIFQFHYATMSLFSKLCRGRNRTIVDYLLLNVETFGVRYKDLLHMLGDSSLPDRYRAAVGDLLITLYIDREPNEYIQPISFIRVWSETKEASPALESEWTVADPYEKFPQLAPAPGFQGVKDVINELLAGVQSFGAMLPEECCLYEVVLGIALKLLQFGCFHKDSQADLETMSDMLDVLLTILETNGETDFEYNDTTKSIFNAKLCVCMVCEFMFDCRVERRMSMVLSAYEDMFAESIPSSDSLLRNSVLDQNSFSRQRLVELEAALFQRPIISKKVASSPNVDAIPEFIRILLNITQYQFLPVAARAFGLMYRHYSQPDVLISNMMQMQIVTVPAISCTIQLLRSDISEVRRNLKWVPSQTSGKRAEAFTKLPVIFKRFLLLCTLGSRVHLSDSVILDIGAVEVLKQCFSSYLCRLGVQIGGWITCSMES